MKALALAPVLALAAFALVAPPQAEAGHRHSDNCGHRQYSRGYGYGYRAPAYRSYGRRYAPYYRGGYRAYGYAPRYYAVPSYGYGYYGSGYDDYGYYPPPPPPRYCRPRPRMGIYFRF